MDPKFRPALLIAFVLLLPLAVHGLGTAFANLRIIVQQESSLIQAGDEMWLKISLSPGVSARLWPAHQCGLPPPDASVVTESGNYTFPIRISDSESDMYYCLRSSDDRLAAAVPVHRAR